MVCHPCILQSTQRQARGAKLEVAASTMPSRRPKKRAEMLRHPYILGDPQQTRTKSEVVASPVPSRGPKGGLRHTAFSRIPNTKRREQNQKWLPQPFLPRGPKEGENATPPLHSRGSPTPSAGSKISSGPEKRGTKSELVASTMPSRRLKRGRKCYVTPTFSGIPNK